MSSSVDRIPLLGSPPVSATIPVFPPFEQIYDDAFDWVWCLARRLGVADANVDDVVQDVFIVLHRRLVDFDGRAPLRAWIRGIVVHVVRDQRRMFRRKEARLVPHDLDSQRDVALICPRPVPSELAEREEALRLLVCLLEQLEEDKREVLVLSELEEMTVPEIAETLGLNVNTVYSRLRAAKRAFEEVHTRHRARDPRRLR